MMAVGKTDKTPGAGRGRQYSVFSGAKLIHMPFQLRWSACRSMPFAHAALS